MIYFSDIKNCESFLEMNKSLEDDFQLNINTDSRKIKVGETFLAITGEKFNAMNFAHDVVSKSASVIIYSQSTENDKIAKSLDSEAIFIKTKNSINFLQEITRILSDRFQDNGGKLIAISGSNGKTTTKEMLFHLLSNVEKQTICTQKNNNNHIGVPLTLLQINTETKFAIVELGSNHPGEIKTLCDIVNPRYGIVTNIGDTHLEFFKNRENVFKEEGYLYTAVVNCEKEGKIFFQNNEDEYLKTFNNKIIRSFGFTNSTSNFSIDKKQVIVHTNKYEYKFTNRHITGKHNFYNLCVAFDVAQNIDPSNAQKYLELCESFKPTANRSQWIEFSGSKVFLDAYNANPSSMRSAIEGFCESVDDSYCLIIGDMNELGEDASRYHEELASELALKNIENIYFIGKYSKAFAAKCKTAKTFSTTEEFKSYFNSNIKNHFKYLFIKGSRSLQLESILDISLH